MRLCGSATFETVGALNIALSQVVSAWCNFYVVAVQVRNSVASSMETSFSFLFMHELEEGYPLNLSI